MKKGLLFLSILLMGCSVYGQTSFLKDSLDTYIEKALRKWEIPGAAVCIVKNGEVIFSKGYGIKELGKEGNVDPNTLFLIGSNTKAFTGTALALLEYEGKLSLQDKVKKWLPDFTMKDPWVASNLNLTDILTHRMGLETFQGDFMYWTSDLTAEEVLEKFEKITPKYDFRTRYGYTNAGFAIAGEIIKAATDTAWGDLIKERFFMPLGMNNSVTFSADFFKAQNIAWPHSLVDFKTTPLEMQNIDNLAPAGSIGSSINDMSKWLIALLDSGNYNGKNIFPYRVIQKTREPQTIIRRGRHPFNTTHYFLYGLGWQLEDYEGKEIVSHTGGVNGFVTSVTLLPEEKAGIVVLTNTDMNLFFQAVKWEIIDALLKLPSRNYSDYYYKIFEKNITRDKELAEARRDSVKMNLQPGVPLDEFIGSYKNDVYGNIDISRTGSILTMTFEHHSRLKGTLESLGGNRFLCTYNDPTYGVVVIPFTFNGSNVGSFTLYVNDFVEFTPYEFVKLKPMF